MPTITEEEVLLTTDDYHRMAEAGILDEDDRIELIDGKIVPMSPIGGAHLFTVNRLNRLFTKAAGPEIEISIQNPVQLGPHQEPEPDAVLFRRLGEVRVPTAEDVLLVVEVADTTLRRDREVKLPRYARAGIPQVWILNLEARRLEIYTQPDEGRYTEKIVHVAREDVPLPHTEKVVQVSDLLP